MLMTLIEGGFRRTLVGLKLGTKPGVGSRRCEFQTYPRGVEAR